ncbi:type II secretion system inner membrane protein GspF [Gilvimarinus sp. SDUM040013]|uniref:General secretion pathway protein F n=1 Tax=Gilvimarinus gilvus TaxID=3058038 RepID=A0ABU4RZG3_9GAMM|nr:type II secretion system inner membrane protein GspF [Gilvimarinus sp. SDUM040013]MDO3388722.1 type II secretion system inner membrane protein GspF [Gilvimarinus sp. SDUM040013]MDX6849617.1 type II secretion system inner membrane protein GspF [Gilvimarinus sp. SDUM040013]
MGAYSYRALNQSGKTVKGMLEGDSERQVRSQLRAKNLKPLEVTDAGTRAQIKTGNSKGFSLFAGTPRLKPRDLSLVTRQLASLISSGLPLDEALQATAKQAQKQSIKQVVLQIRTKVLEGFSLAQALSEHPQSFDDMYRAMVRAGESSGYLGPVLDRLAEHTLNSQQLKARLKTAMIYPVVLLVLSLAVIIGLMAFVVPDLVKLFAHSSRELPFLTRALIGTSDFIVGYGIWVLAAGFGAMYGIKRLLKNERRLRRWHQIQLRLPVIGNVANQSNSARFAATLSLLMSSGVPLLQALRIAGQVMTNRVLQDACEQIANQVHEGTALNRALEKADCFPPLLVQMVASGETNGTLPAQLEHAARDQQRELEMVLAVSLGLMEPATIVIMGGAVLVIVLAILQPIFEMNQMVG